MHNFATAVVDLKIVNGKPIVSSMSCITQVKNITSGTENDDR